MNRSALRVAIKAALLDEREACANKARAMIEECRNALAEELAAWDIDPPLHHVKQAHDRLRRMVAL